LVFLPHGPPDIQQALDQGVVGDEGISPHRRDQLFLGHEAARMLGEIAEHLEGLRPEFPFLVASKKRDSVYIDYEFTEPQLARARVGLSRKASGCHC